MKQKNVVVESYKGSDDLVTYIVRVPGTENQWTADKITTNPAELADYFSKIL